MDGILETEFAEQFKVSHRIGYAPIYLNISAFIDGPKTARTAADASQQPLEAAEEMSAAC